MSIFRMILYSFLMGQKYCGFTQKKNDLQLHYEMFLQHFSQSGLLIFFVIKPLILEYFKVAPRIWKDNF